MKVRISQKDLCIIQDFFDRNEISTQTWAELNRALNEPYRESNQRFWNELLKMEDEESCKN